MQENECWVDDGKEKAEWWYDDWLGGKWCYILCEIMNPLFSFVHLVNEGVGQFDYTIINDLKASEGAFTLITGKTTKIWLEQFNMTCPIWLNFIKVSN